MRLRTLKKLSKQAAPILVKHYGREVFLAERGENYHGLLIQCHCPKARSTKSLARCECQWHPLKGTPMTGEMSGYYEPEWSERTAFEDLHDRVLWGDRPKRATDAEWAAIMEVARLTAADIQKSVAALENWARETASNGIEVEAGHES